MYVLILVHGAWCKGLNTALVPIIFCSEKEVNLPALKTASTSEDWVAFADR